MSERENKLLANFLLLHFQKLLPGFVPSENEVGERKGEMVSERDNLKWKYIYLSPSLLSFIQFQGSV